MIESDVITGRSACPDPSLFRQIVARDSSLSERIADEIRSLIETGKLHPGDRLPSERELARSFNVSRPALREAVRGLAAIGLIEIRWGQGAFVRATDLDLILKHVGPLVLSSDDLASLYAVRRLLEVAAAGWAAERAVEEERAELATLWAEVSANEEEFCQNPARMQEIDRRFHNLIAMHSHNPVLVRLMLGLLDLLAAARQRSFAIAGRARHSLAEHSEIVDAILSRDADAAQAAMLVHLKKAEAAVRGAV